MKKNFAILCTLALLVFCNHLLAQEKPYVVNGKVTSFEESTALEGVSIYVKGTKNNTGTQPDGTFSLEITSGNKVLVFELKDYERQEVTITGKKQYDIVLKRNGGNAKTNVRITGALLAKNNVLNKRNEYPADIMKD